MKKLVILFLKLLLFKNIKNYKKVLPTCLKKSERKIMHFSQEQNLQCQQVPV